MNLLDKVARIAAFIAFCAALCIAPSASASAIGFGGDQYGDCTIGCAARYQQVYSASRFDTAPVSITRITFFSFATFSSTPVFQLTLSTAARFLSSGLSSKFAENIGADALLFQAKTFTDVLVGSLVSFDGMFDYDPNEGDLLIDIVRMGEGNFFSGPYLRAGYDQGYQRAYSYGSAVNADGDTRDFYGNKTQFEFHQIPEPASLAFAGLGLLGLLAMLATRSARRQQTKADASASLACAGCT